MARLKDSRIKEILKKELENIDNHGSQTLESIEELNDEIFIGLIEKQIEINKTTKTVNEQWLSNTLKKLKKSKDE